MLTPTDWWPKKIFFFESFILAESGTALSVAKDAIFSGILPLLQAGDIVLKKNILGFRTLLWNENAMISLVADAGYWMLDPG